MGKISNYARVIKAKLQDVFVIDTTDNNVTTTKSVTVEQIGDAICGEQVHADLETDDQTIIGGINENKDKVGDLSTLTTTDKSSLVGAVNEIARYTPVYGNTASGSIATFDTSLALPLQNCTIDINAVQESGTPTPSSPKAISGFTGANIHVADDENPHVIDNVTAITWQDEAGTVYGGSLDVTTGVLTVTRKIIDMGSLTWNTVGMGGGRTGFKSTISDIELAPAAIVVFNGICECYASLNGNDVYLGNTGIATWGANTHDIAVYDPDRESLSGNDFKTAVTGSDLVYTLQTPVTYQLTPTQINAIVGTNNVFTDTNGDTSVMYACSLKDYIDSQ